MKCEANESVQFSTCYEPIHRFWRVKTKSSFFSKIKTCLRKKKCTTFLVLLRSTCVQKLSQFEFLTLAIKNFIFVWFLHGCLLKCDRVILFCKVLSTGSFFPSNVTVTNRQLLKKSTSWSRKWPISKGNLHFEISSN